MKLRSTSLLLLAIAIPIGVTHSEPSSSPQKPFLEKVFVEGHFSFDLRLRYEFANEQGLDASHAATARTRLGYGTNAALPLSAFVELEDITALDSSAYNQAGLNDQPQKTVIADPETTEVNQAFLHFKQADLFARLGRQRLILDNQRFVGNVGWRQNEQTFDALTLQYQRPEGPALLYSYLDQVNRVLGREHPMGRWQSDSHLVNVRSPLGEFGTGGAYIYLLQFEEAPAMSGDTFGFWVRPALPQLPLPTTLHLEIAHQRDNSGNAAGADFSHTYFRGELETTLDRFTIGGGFERLGGNGTTAFQTPLATLHAFNGWADQFLATPADGLDDIFVFATVKLPAQITGRINAHHFSSHRGNTTYGQEIDLLLSKPLGENLSLLAKAALFDGKEGRPDVTKLWLQAELRF